jgi:hypothetical protein
MIDLMKSYKDSINIDLEVDPRPLTVEEEKMISDFILSDKKKREQKQARLKVENKK